MAKNTLVRNTMILIVTSLFIKIMALTNRVILTRMLGNEGISLYILVLPSIMLFLSLGSLSLNTTITKLVAVKKSKDVIKKGLIIAFYASSIFSIVLLILLKPLTFDWLKQPKAYYPLLLTIPLIYLSAVNSVLRGFYNGIKKVNITSSSILIEQIARISVSVLLLLKFYSHGVEFAVSLAIIAMSVGEVASILYAGLMIKKYKPASETLIPSKDILNVAIPLSASRLIGNITFFLEPIVFTLALTMLRYDSQKIMFRYSEVSAYSIPLITMFSFVSTAIATAIIPHVATSSKKQVSRYITSSLTYAFLPAIPISLILTTYAKDYMQLIYGTSIGVRQVQMYTFLFILFYLQAPLTSIMQAANHTKSLLVFFTVADLLRLGLVFALPFVSNDGLIIAMLISSSVFVLMLFVYLKKKYRFSWTTQEKINITLVALVCSVFLIIVKVGNLHYLLSTGLLVVVFLLLLQYLGLFRFNQE